MKGDIWFEFRGGLRSLWDEGVDLVTGWLHYGTAERPSVSSQV